jgi:hypothetical protein
MCNCGDKCRVVTDSKSGFKYLLYYCDCRKSWITFKVPAQRS